MHISKLAASPVRTDALQRAQGSGAPDAPVGAASPSRATDAVHISDAGLALANEGMTGGTTASLDPKRADQIRSSILSGAYNSLEMADQVARAVIRSGDV